MSGRHPFSKLTKDLPPARRERIDELKVELNAGMAVLLKFRNAFPDLYLESKSYHTIVFRPCGYEGATVYFRKSKLGPNQARIHSGWLKNFPNASRLGDYLTKRRVKIDRSESHPDYLVGPADADAVISILKDGLERRTTE